MAVPDTKAIIFDCFGVLYLDTTTSLLVLVPDDKHQAVEDLFMANNYGHFTKQQYIAQLTELTGLGRVEIEQYIKKEHHLNDGLIELINDTLRSKYRVGLLSNIGRGWINEFFDVHQVHDLFDEVVLSGEEGIAKPHPAIYELMASRLALKPEQCVMVDDIKENCDGAEMAGMRAIHFRSNRQLSRELERHGVSSTT